MLGDLISKIIPEIVEEFVEDLFEGSNKAQEKEYLQKIKQLETELKHERQLKTARSTLIKYYLVFWNDYLTIEKFAEHHGLTTEQATIFIELGKQIFNSKHPEE